MDYRKRVFRTIKKWKLVEPKDKIFVALSGGKDSASALFLLKEYIEAKDVDAQLFGFHINFGIPISDEVQKVVEEQAKLCDVPLKVVNVRDMGISLERAMKRSGRPLCSVCGVLKRYLMNRIPRELGATKVATGHHMDDFLVFFFKNMLGLNFEWISKFKPKIESENGKLLCKIRPLFFVGSRENQDFCLSQGIPFLKEDVCPHTYVRCYLDLRREKWYRTIYEIEKRHKDFRYRFALALARASQFFPRGGGVRECKICGEPTSEEICAFCKIFR